MISPPGNSVFSLFLVPVFEWEPVEPASDAAAPPPAPSCEVDSDPQPATSASSAPAMRLVLKRYEWRPGFEYLAYPAPWANCFDNGSYEAREDAAQQESERRARAIDATRQHKAQLRPTPINPTIEPTGAPTATGDDSVSE